MRVWFSVPSVDTHAVPGRPRFVPVESTRQRPVEHPDQRSRQERRFLRISLRQVRPHADGYVAWASSEGSIDGLAEATAMWSDTKIAVA